MKKHVLSALVHNRPGVTSRVSGLFRRRGFNIESFIGCVTEDERFSRLTIALEGDDVIISQVMSQMKKLEDVIHIETMDPSDSVVKVLLFMKVKIDQSTRTDVIVLADAYRARLDEIKPDYVIIEAIDGDEKVTEMIEAFSSFGIIELVKTGIVAMKK